MKTPSVAEFKKWAKANRPLAKALVNARAFAESERKRVDGYLIPLFRSFGMKDEKGILIEHPDKLYLCHDGVLIAAYFEVADAANRAHGFTGPEGHCPAYRAEEGQRRAERELIQAWEEFFDIDGQLYGEARERLLTLLIDSCLGDERFTTARDLSAAGISRLRP